MQGWPKLSPEGVCISAGRNFRAHFSGCQCFPTPPARSGDQRVCAFRLDEMLGLKFLDVEVVQGSIQGRATHPSIF